MSEGADQPDDAFSKQALDHAWAWFALHAGHRMQAVNYFFVAAAFMTSGYSVALNAQLPAVAAVIAGFGAVMTIYFNRLELRIRELLKASESALAASQARLALQSGISSIGFVAAVEAPQRPFTSYAKVFGLMHWTAFFGFCLACVFGSVRALS